VSDNFLHLLGSRGNFKARFSGSRKRRLLQPEKRALKFPRDSNAFSNVFFKSHHVLIILGGYEIGEKRVLSNLTTLEISKWMRSFFGTKIGIEIFFCLGKSEFLPEQLGNFSNDA